MIKKSIAVFLPLLLLLVFCFSGTKTRKDSVAVFQPYAAKSAEAHAENLIKALYGTRVTFWREHGDDTTFQTRYYCSNICVDACADRSVRYLSDIRAVGGEDPLLEWLYERDGATVLHSEMQNGIECRKVKNESCIAELSILQQTGRVFAAKIIFFS